MLREFYSSSKTLDSDRERQRKRDLCEITFRVAEITFLIRLGRSIRDEEAALRRPRGDDNFEKDNTPGDQEVMILVSRYVENNVLRDLNYDEKDKSRR